MLERQDAAAEVAEKLFAAEAAIDAAVSATAELLGELPRARKRAGLAATVGQPVIENAAAALLALTNARAEVVSMHEALATIHRRAGWGSFAIGPMNEKDDQPPPVGEISAPSAPRENQISQPA